MADFYVFVSDVPFDGLTLGEIVADSSVNQYYHEGPLINDSVSIATNASGRYLRVQQTSNLALSLAEVEVMGWGN